MQTVTNKARSGQINKAERSRIRSSSKSLVQQQTHPPLLMDVFNETIEQIDASIDSSVVNGYFHTIYTLDTNQCVPRLIDLVKDYYESDGYHVTVMNLLVEKLLIIDWTGNEND